MWSVCLENVCMQCWKKMYISWSMTNWEITNPSVHASVSSSLSTSHSAPPEVPSQFSPVPCFVRWANHTTLLLTISCILTDELLEWYPLVISKIHQMRFFIDFDLVSIIQRTITRRQEHTCLQEARAILQHGALTKPQPCPIVVECMEFLSCQKLCSISYLPRNIV